MKILTKIYQQNLDYWPESIEIGISEHITFSPDSIENISHYHDERWILLYNRIK